MRNLIAVAVVMLVASVVVSFAVAQPPLVEDSRGNIVGWGYTYQEAQRDAYQQADAVGKPYKVCGFRSGTNPHHDPHCWWMLLINWEDPDIFLFFE